METDPINITGLVAVIGGLLTVLIPITGLTLRFALKPVVDAIGRYKELTQDNREVEMLEKRIALLERQMENVDTGLERLSEDVEFHRRLASPEP